LPHERFVVPFLPFVVLLAHEALLRLGRAGLCLTSVVGVQ
jgi:hypothetical protein